MAADEKTGSIHIGCSGALSLEWRGAFYSSFAASQEMLEQYFDQFNTLEINGTYYGFLRAQTLAQWCDMAPSGFLFSLKVPLQLITAKPGKEMKRRCDQLARMIEPLRRNQALGSLYIQWPHNLDPDLERLSALLEAPVWQGSDVVIDFKTPCPLGQDIIDLIADKGADLAAVSRADKEPYLGIHSNHKYFRFNGTKRGKNCSYPFRELMDWKTHINAAAQEVDRVYVYFNNHGKGHAAINAYTLIHKILDADPTSGQ